tara:strand:- start:3166 stop:3588 length:423 start_codon:yes stop_codon:yes gene_type:complete
MADGSGTNNKARASYQSDSYMFTMDDSSASSHSLGMKDSGKTYFLESTVARTITLPAVKAGLKFKFIATNTTADSSITTSEGTALLKGGAECGDAYLTLAGTTIVVEAAGAVGDWLELISDGTYWYVSGHGSHDASFSVS